MSSLRGGHLASSEPEPEEALPVTFNTNITGGNVISVGDNTTMTVGTTSLSGYVQFVMLKGAFCYVGLISKSGDVGDGTCAHVWSCCGPRTRSPPDE